MDGEVSVRGEADLIYPSRFKPTLNANNAYNAAVQRLGDAEFLFDGAERYGRDGLYTSAIYLAGLAAECMFTAYVLKGAPAAGVDRKHRIMKLVKAGAFADLATPGRETEELNEAIGRIVRYWRNEVRYFDDNAFVRAPSLLNTDPPRKLRGDLVKRKRDIAVRVLRASRVVREIGVKKLRT